MNNVVLIGRLTRDPELRYTQGGTAVASFTLAVDRGLSREKKQEMESMNQPTADFINIVVWGKMGENCANYLAKGRLTAVQGRIQTGSYEGKDGIRRYTTDVVANNVEFLEWGDKKSDNSQGGGFDGGGFGGFENPGFGGVEGFQPSDNDDIPF